MSALCSFQRLKLVYTLRNTLHKRRIGKKKIFYFSAVYYSALYVSIYQPLSWHDSLDVQSRASSWYTMFIWRSLKTGVRWYYCLCSCQSTEGLAVASLKYSLHVSKSTKPIVGWQLHKRYLPPVYRLPCLKDQNVLN